MSCLKHQGDDSFYSGPKTILGAVFDTSIAENLPGVWDMKNGDVLRAVRGWQSNVSLHAVWKDISVSLGAVSGIFNFERGRIAAEIILRANSVYASLAKSVGLTSSMKLSSGDSLVAVSFIKEVNVSTGMKLSCGQNLIVPSSAKSVAAAQSIILSLNVIPEIRRYRTIGHLDGLTVDDVSDWDLYTFYYLEV